MPMMSIYVCAVDLGVDNLSTHMSLACRSAAQRFVPPWLSSYRHTNILSSLHYCSRVYPLIYYLPVAFPKSFYVERNVSARQRHKVFLIIPICYFTAYTASSKFYLQSTKLRFLYSWYHQKSTTKVTER
ncbi:hypothetical protein BR93DRAFT_484928 [Coniochaeta sp. PMI_546]|nr:hypothetical protein BR93DRAFT_484928 [Coniochaeta sp. PMI_546]